jgi:hypothetical protein
MTWLSWLAGVTAAGCAVPALVRMRRDRSAVVLMAALAILGLAASMAVPAALPVPARLRPEGLAAAWLAACAGLAGIWLFRGVLAAAASRARPRAPLAVPALGTAASGICLALHSLQAPGPWSGAQAAGIELALCRLIPLACCCPAQAGIALLSWRSAHRIKVRHMRAGMRAVTAGAAAALAAALTRAAAAGCHLRGETGPPAGVAAGLQAGAVILLCAGATAPAWWAAAAPLAGQAGLWRAYWQLRPLWAALSGEVPAIRLAPVPVARWHARYLLHRRVIEIRDAQLALRPYAGHDAAELAAAAADAHGLTSAEREAAAEAALLAAAIRARRSGAPYAGLAARRAAAPQPAGGTGEPDLLAEAAALVMISRALRRQRSPQGRPARR